MGAGVIRAKEVQRPCNANYYRTPVDLLPLSRVSFLPGASRVDSSVAYNTGVSFQHSAVESLGRLNSLLIGGELLFVFRKSLLRSTW